MGSFRRFVLCGVVGVEEIGDPGMGDIRVDVVDDGNGGSADLVEQQKGNQSGYENHDHHNADNNVATRWTQDVQDD